MAKRRAKVFPATKVLLTVVLIGACMFSAPVLAGALAGTDSAHAAAPARSLGLSADNTPSTKVAVQGSPAATIRTTAQPKRVAPTPVAPVTNPKSTATYSATKTTATSTVKPRTSELATAKAILASMIAKHPILAGTTVTFGTTPGGYQAVAYYKSARILISPTHTASLTKIITHECWHIIDWRDNGVIDWGENVPR